MAKKTVTRTGLPSSVAIKPLNQGLQPGPSKTNAAPPARTLDVKLTHSPNYKAAQKWRDTAVNLVIGDKASHVGALNHLKEGKTIRKSSASYYKETKQKIDGVKKIVLDLEKEELDGTLDIGLAKVEERIVLYVNAEKERIEAADKLKRDAEEKKAREKRDAELAEQEAAALKLEEESPNLSAGELWFVTKVVERDIDMGRGMAADLKAMRGFIVGYQDVEKTLTRFLKSEKILTAVANAREAIAIREQAAALREEPIEPVTIESTESNIGKVSGTHMTKHYSFGGVRDLDKLRAAYMAGELDVDAFMPNPVVLNREAKTLEAKFEQAYPGAILKVTEGVAG